jgi:hypothetical protein
MHGPFMIRAEDTPACRSPSQEHTMEHTAPYYIKAGGDGGRPGGVMCVCVPLSTRCCRKVCFW